MPIPRIIPQTVDLHCRYTYDNNLYENVYQFFYGHTPPAAELHQLALDWVGVVFPSLQACLPNSVTFREVFCKDVGYVNGTETTDPFPANTTGTRSGSGLPGQDCKSITLKTAHSGRQYKGAKRIGPLSESDTDRNELSNVIMSLLAALATQMLRTLVVGLFVPEVGSPTYHTTAPLTGFSIPTSEVGTMNTRKGGRGQ